MTSLRGSTERGKHCRTENIRKLIFVLGVQENNQINLREQGNWYPSEGINNQNTL